jgi:hypothetical protein
MRLPLVYIDIGVNINGEYYKTEILEKHLLPASSKTKFHHTKQTAFNSGATKICQILFPKLASQLARFESTEFFHMGPHVDTTRNTNTKICPISKKLSQ